MAGRLTVFRERRITAIAEMLVLNFTTDQIIQGLQRRGISTPSRLCINEDIRFIKSEMRDRRQMILDARINLELAVLETIREKALSAWEDSRRGTVTRETSEESEPTLAVGVPAFEEGNPIGNAVRQMLQGGGVRQGKVTAKVKEVSSSGDPRFLDTAREASRDIRTLLGVDPIAVKKIELTTRDSGPVSIEDLRKMDPTDIARLVSDEIAKLAGS